MALYGRVSALCRRLKKMFTAGKLAQERTGGGCDGGDADQMNVTVQGLSVNVNPYAPYSDLDNLETSWVQVEKEEVVRKESRSRSRKKKKERESSGLTIRKVLCFSSTESAAQNNNSSSANSSSPWLSSSSQSSDSQSVKLRQRTSRTASRYHREFHEVELIGCGVFGTVYRCVNRMDGCVYAIKRSQALAKSKYAQRRASNEVHANAVLNNSRYVVRYYSAWMEDDCVSIQQEYCDGGDLAAVIAMMRRDRTSYEEEEICRLLLHLAKGLRYIHASKLAHLDIKPENIFISSERVFTDHQSIGGEVEQVVYKIGDLGHVSPVTNVLELEDEGDCRYLSKEILREDYTDLTKADIFALGLTIYEACGGGPPPKNGPKWHAIREGKLNRLMGYSNDLNELLLSMVHLDPEKRPSAAELLSCELLKAIDAMEKV